MKILFKLLFLILTISNCKTVDNNDCDLKFKIFNEIFHNEEIKKYLHPEIKDRLPYVIIFDNNECELKSDLFYTASKDRIVPEHFIEILDYNIEGNKINMSFFYNLEGININCELSKNDSGKIEVESVNFIEI